MGRRLFCEINPFFYILSTEKEILKRKCKDTLSKTVFAYKITNEKLPVVLKTHSSLLLRNLYGVDMQLQRNKVDNIELACEKINGLIIHPGETFSFWKLIGRPNAKRGFKEGLVIKSGKPASGIGGGLCQMANLIHWLVLNCAFEVVELNHHTDALFPDDRRRVPFGTGTSVSYNYLDYRFRNNTDSNIQILAWCEDGELHGEIRSNKELPYTCELIEKDMHFQKEGDKFYRVSKVFRIINDPLTGNEIKRELILDNHSEVMYDYSQIPGNEIF